MQGVLLTLPLAFALWCFTFAVPAGNFWLKLCSSALVLSLTALRLAGRERKTLFPFKARHLWVGILSALVLYAIFWLGSALSSMLFPFAPREISSIYSSKVQLSPALIGLLLLFIMGPAEEIYWRGFVQRNLTRRLGPVKGVLITAVIYSLVHLAALNFMLLVAAGVCGLYWGWIYQREQSLVPVILSHSVWDVLIFVLFPVR